MNLHTHHKLFLRAAIDGMIAGLVLTLFLKVIQFMTGYKVYTLLLNIDYIPILNVFKFPEIVEVIFHLIVSVVLATVLILILRQLPTISSITIIALCIFVSFIIGGLYFPTTIFSERTPPLSSLPSFFYWMVGHVLYGSILGILFSSRRCSR